MDMQQREFKTACSWATCALAMDNAAGITVRRPKNNALQQSDSELFAHLSVLGPRGI